MTDFTISPATFDASPQTRSSARSFDAAILLGTGLLLVAFCAVVAALPIGSGAMPTDGALLFVF